MSSCWGVNGRNKSCPLIRYIFFSASSADEPIVIQPHAANNTSLPEDTQVAQSAEVGMTEWLSCGSPESFRFWTTCHHHLHHQQQQQQVLMMSMNAVFSVWTSSLKHIHLRGLYVYMNRAAMWLCHSFYLWSTRIFIFFKLISESWEYKWHKSHADKNLFFSCAL